MRNPADRWAELEAKYGARTAYLGPFSRSTWLTYWLALEVFDNHPLQGVPMTNHRADVVHAGTDGTPGTTGFKEHADFYRREVKRVAGGLKHFLNTEKATPHDSVAPNPDRGEMIANLTLAYRHLEDSSMRIGKAMQANDGGTSVYDDSTVGAPDETPSA